MFIENFLMQCTIVVAKQSYDQSCSVIADYVNNVINHDNWSIISADFENVIA